jgi:hypothetical protein
LGMRERMVNSSTSFEYVDEILHNFELQENNLESAVNDIRPVVSQIPLVPEVGPDIPQAEVGEPLRPKRRRIDYSQGVPGVPFANHRSSRAVDRSGGAPEIIQASTVRLQQEQGFIPPGMPILAAYKVAVRTDDTPTVRRALAADRSDREEWRAAIRKELQSLFDQKTIEAVSEREPNRRSRIVRAVMQLKVLTNTRHSAVQMGVNYQMKHLRHFHPLYHHLLCFWYYNLLSLIDYICVALM